MAHPQQFCFVESVRQKCPEHFVNSKVLEVGSLDINGSVRPLFVGCDYLGIDVGEGKGVDLVCQGQDLDHKDSTYDVSISCECFEHNPYWVETFKNMHRMTKENGLVIMSCATTGRPEHGTRRSSPADAPLVEWDYYKNLTEQDFVEAMPIQDMFSEYQFSTNTGSKDLYFYGIKK